MNLSVLSGKSIRTLGWFLTATFSSATLAVTDQASDFTEEDLFIDIPQVISATHLSQKLTEAPAAISIIDQHMIEASGALNIPDLFRLVPGMQVFHVNTNKMGVTYHGVTDDFPSRMEVMINGRSIYIPLLSTVVWETIGITVDDIDYIEVVRGSNVPTHGSNAFLGAINIITKYPVAESGTAVKATTGSLGTKNVTARHSDTVSNISYTLSAGSEKNDGSDYYNDGAHNKFITLSGSLTPNLSDTIHFDVGATKGYAYRGDSDKKDIDDAGFTPREHLSNFQDIRWSRVLEDQSELQLRYSHNYLKLETENFTAEELVANGDAGPFSVAQVQAILDANYGSVAPKDTERGTAQTHTVGFLYTTNPSEEVSAVIGSDLIHERVKSDVLLQYPDKDWIHGNRWQLFGNVQYKATDKVTLNAGAMFEESSFIGGAASYRTALNYALSDVSTIRTAFSHAHRMPSLLETNRRALIDYSAIIPGTTDLLNLPGHLDSEEIDTFELGFFYIWPEHGSHFDLRIFYEDISNATIRSTKIDPAPEDTFDGDYDIGQNNSEWTNQGAEFQFKYADPSPHKNTLIFNYSYNQTRGIWNRGAYPEANPRLVPINPISPLHTASLLLSTKPTDNSLVALTHYYMDHAEWIEGFSNKNSGRTNYTRTDLKLSNTYQLDTHSELELSLIVQNLFDSEYAEFYSNNIFGRRTYLQLGLTF
ncbi:TonB-dependent siderophore receptor [uncultured Neptuniibacter sp.]|uniref:TonB-dependent receptor plug domain-containing protein n=1 Tax=uncultured Neptuniibacter sp. TaxID=502143 RepID=UPI00260679B1|nr:TonB-dependent receptor [uncultured Neptuniibacter sp.]